MAESINTNTSSEVPDTQRLSDVALAQIETKNKKEQRSKLAHFLRGALGVLGAIIAVYFTVLAVLFTMGWEAAPSPLAAEVAVVEEAIEEPVEVVDTKGDKIDLSTWSNEELAAQMCMVMVDSGASGELRAWTERGAGAILLIGNNPKQTLKADIEAAQAKAANSVRAFIATDDEGGQKKPLDSLAGSLPSATEMGTWDKGAIEKATEQHGRRLSELGVNMVLGPVVDIAYTGAALTDTGRVFSADCDVVAESARAWAAGMSKAGVGTTLKHWPGLGGYAVPGGVVTAYKPWTTYEKDDACAFKKSYSANTTMVMVSHVIVPDFTETGTPTSLSKNAYGYLRKDVGGDTIILTDSVDLLVHPGVATSAEQAAVEAIRAGADMVLCRPGASNDMKVAKALAEAISSGTISRRDAEAKVARIVQAKVDRELSPQLISK